jgi:pimeloyl-ACP methyl ester carboxylesterase
MLARVADDGHRAYDQQPPQISITLLGDAAEPVLAAAVLCWRRLFHPNVERDDRRERPVYAMVVGTWSAWSPAASASISTASTFGPMIGAVIRCVADNVEDAIIPDCGHWITEEQPAATTKLVVDFLHRRS